MNKYMLVLGGVERKSDLSKPAQYQEIMAKHGAWIESLSKRQMYVSSHKLEVGKGTRLTAREGRVVAGPYIETKETIGGYYIILAPSLEAATEEARSCPIVADQGGWVEVRPIEI
jgi:hypothetical protein